ncbi:MAG: hypothetical protein N4A47_04005 [Clostridia bacterium]|nr:hypothetical protein [Clostridia bacterium]
MIKKVTGEKLDLQNKLDAIKVIMLSVLPFVNGQDILDLVRDGVLGNRELGLVIEFKKGLNEDFYTETYLAGAINKFTFLQVMESMSFNEESLTKIFESDIDSKAIEEKAFICKHVPKEFFMDQFDKGNISNINAYFDNLVFDEDTYQRYIDDGSISDYNLESAICVSSKLSETFINKQIEDGVFKDNHIEKVLLFQKKVTNDFRLKHIDVIGENSISYFMKFNKNELTDDILIKLIERGLYGYNFEALLTTQNINERIISKIIEVKPVSDLVDTRSRAFMNPNTTPEAVEKLTSLTGELTYSEKEILAAREKTPEEVSQFGVIDYSETIGNKEVVNNQIDVQIGKQTDKQIGTGELK